MTAPPGDEHDLLHRWSERSLTPWGRLQRDLIRARVMSWLPETPRTVLDVGCGFAELSIELASRGSRVVAIDRSEPILRQAGQNARSAGVSIDFRHHDVDAGLELGNFDLVLGHFVLPYSRDPRRALRRLIEAVGSGGRLSVANSNPTAAAIRQAVFSRDLDGALQIARGGDTQHDGPCGPRRQIAPRDLLEWLADMGMAVEHEAGVFIVTTLLANELKDGEHYHKLLELELLLGEREDLRRIGGITHLWARPTAR